MNFNDGTHSRFDQDHYSKCQSCYEDHLDFVQDQVMDAAAERAEYQDEE